MSVFISTNLGGIVIDLHTDKCPLTCKNFLKLCKIDYYKNCIFHTVQKDFIAQTGDRTGTGTGGDSIYKFLYGDQARFFRDEIHHELTHTKKGTVAMASGGENLNASQFYITLGKDLDYLDEKHTVFGVVIEGFDVLSKINEAYVDWQNKPCKSIRINKITIRGDPFEDPPNLAEFIIPDRSPEEEDEDDDGGVEDEEDLVEVMKEKSAHSSAVALECIGDIQAAEIKPPENVLFVCKLNPLTEKEDLDIIFSKFGKVVSVDVKKDFKTGKSLCYAFVEFEKKEDCEEAYRKIKMKTVEIDDREIQVDFSQSVPKLWSEFKFKSKGKESLNYGSTDSQSSKYIVKYQNRGNRGGRGYHDMVFKDDRLESPKRRKRRDHCHEEEMICRRSLHGHGENKRRRRDDAEDEANKYNGRRKHPEEVRKETNTDKRQKDRRRR